MVAPTGCKRSGDGEGSAEQAGRKIDNVLEKAGQETGKLMERIGESMQKAAEKYKTILKIALPKSPPTKLHPSASLAALGGCLLLTFSHQLTYGASESAKQTKDPTSFQPYQLSVINALRLHRIGGQHEIAPTV